MEYGGVFPAFRLNLLGFQMGGEESKYKIPKNLDAPIPILKWELTEVVVATMVLGVGFVAESLLFGTIGFIVVLKIGRSLRQGQKQGQVQHLLWRAGILIDKPLKLHGPTPLILEYYE